MNFDLPDEQVRVIGGPGTVVIRIHPSLAVTGDKRADKPLRITEWTSMIDKALKPARPARGAPRPIFDPEAESMTPIAGWTASGETRHRLRVVGE